MRTGSWGCVLIALIVLLWGAGTVAQEDHHLKDVVYGHKLGVALTMDVFKPGKPNGIGVLWMVSGGRVSNHESINPGLAKIFTDRGQTVFEVVHGSQPRFFFLRSCRTFTGRCGLFARTRRSTAWIRTGLVSREAAPGATFP